MNLVESYRCIVCVQEEFFENHKYEILHGIMHGLQNVSNNTFSNMFRMMVESPDAGIADEDVTFSVLIKSEKRTQCGREYDSTLHELDICYNLKNVFICMLVNAINVFNIYEHEDVGVLDKIKTNYNLRNTPVIHMAHRGLISTIPYWQEFMRVYTEYRLKKHFRVEFLFPDNSVEQSSVNMGLLQEVVPMFASVPLQLDNFTLNPDFVIRDSQYGYADEFSQIHVVSATGVYNATPLPPGERWTTIFITVSRVTGKRDVVNVVEDTKCRNCVFPTDDELRDPEWWVERGKKHESSGVALVENAAAWVEEGLAIFPVRIPDNCEVEKIIYDHRMVTVVLRDADPMYLLESESTFLSWEAAHVTRIFNMLRVIISTGVAPTDANGLLDAFLKFKDRFFKDKYFQKEWNQLVSKLEWADQLHEVLHRVCVLSSQNPLVWSVVENPPEIDVSSIEKKYDRVMNVDTSHGSIDAYDTITQNSMSASFVRTIADL